MESHQLKATLDDAWHAAKDVLLGWKPKAPYGQSPESIRQACYGLHGRVPKDTNKNVF